MDDWDAHDGHWTPRALRHRDLIGRRDTFLMEIDRRAPWADMDLATIEAAFAQAKTAADDGDDLARQADEILRRRLPAGMVA